MELNQKKELVGRHGLFRKPSTRNGEVFFYRGFSLCCNCFSYDKLNLIRPTTTYARINNILGTNGVGWCTPRDASLTMINIWTKFSYKISLTQ